MPKRCPRSRASEHFDVEIRQLLYGKGRNAYRVLFTIADEQDGEETGTIRILHVRPAAQQSLRDR